MANSRLVVQPFLCCCHLSSALGPYGPWYSNATAKPTYMIGLANHKVEIILLVWLIACRIEQQLTTCHLQRIKINTNEISFFVLFCSENFFYQRTSCTPASLGSHSLCSKHERQLVPNKNSTGDA